MSQPILSATVTAGLVYASDARPPSTAGGLANEFARGARAAKRGGTAMSYRLKG
jgi:hypothetical protein